QVLPQSGSQPGRLRDGADHLAPEGAGRAAAQGRQGDRGLRQPHLPQSGFRAQPDRPGKEAARHAGMSGDSLPMTSYRPYLLRALTEWINDNGMTPHILVDAGVSGVQVPPGVVHDGRVVLNIADRAVV